MAEPTALAAMQIEHLQGVNLHVLNPPDLNKLKGASLFAIFPSSRKPAPIICLAQVA